MASTFIELRELLLEAIRATDFTEVARLVAMDAQLLMGRWYQNGYSPLHLAVSMSRLEMTTHLLDLGANPSYRTQNNGDSPLHLAVFHNCLDIAAMLLAHGADPDLQNNHGKTSLACANSEEFVRLLLNAGADPAIKDGNGLTAMQFFAKQRWLNLAEIVQKSELEKRLNQITPHSVQAFATANPDLAVEIAKKFPDQAEDIAFAAYLKPGVGTLLRQEILIEVGKIYPEKVGIMARLVLDAAQREQRGPKDTELKNCAIAIGRVLAYEFPDQADSIIKEMVGVVKNEYLQAVASTIGVYPDPEDVVEALSVAYPLRGRQDYWIYLRLQQMVGKNLSDNLRLLEPLTQPEEKPEPEPKEAALTQDQIQDMIWAKISASINERRLFATVWDIPAEDWDSVGKDGNRSPSHLVPGSPSDIAYRYCANQYGVKHVKLYSGTISLDWSTKFKDDRAEVGTLRSLTNEALEKAMICAADYSCASVSLHEERPAVVKRLTKDYLELRLKQLVCRRLEYRNDGDWAILRDPLNRIYMRQIQWNFPTNDVVIVWEKDGRRVDVWVEVRPRQK